MTPKQTVMKLYAAYASRDPERISALLDPGVIWVAPAGNATQVAFGQGSPDDAGAPRGANDLEHDEIVAFMAYNFARFFTGASLDFRSMVADGDVVITEHRMSATLPNGRPYVNDYCFAFEVTGGRVSKMREYMDTRGGWVQVFGEASGRAMLDFVEGPIPTPGE